jgi:hypothetical protein
MVAALGSVGVLSGLNLTEEIASSAAPETKQQLMAMGLSISMYTDAFARLCVLLVGPFLAFVVAVGHLVAVRGERGEWTPVPGVAAGVLVFLGLCVSGFLGGIRIAEGYASPMVLMGAVIAVLALPCVVAVGVRADADREKKGGTAAARFVVWVALLLAAWGAAGLPEVSGTIMAFKAIAAAAPEQKAEMLRVGMELAQADGRAGLGTFAALFVVGAALLFPLTDSLKRGKLTTVGLAINLVFLLSVGGLVSMANGGANRMMLSLNEEMDAPETPYDPGTDTLDLGG